MSPRYQILYALAVACFAVGCGSRGDHGDKSAKADLPRIVKQLRSENPRLRERAKTELAELAEAELSGEECFFLLDAAKQPAEDDAELDPSAVLIDVVLKQGERIHWAKVVGEFDQYSRRARRNILEALIEKADSRSAAIIGHLAAQYSASDAMPPVDFIPLLDSRQATEASLADLVGNARGNDFGYSVHWYALCAAEQNVEYANILTPYARQLVEIHEGLRARMKPLETEANTDWIWEESYANDRAHATLLLDLMKHLPFSAVRDALNDSVQSLDPRVAYFAAKSLLYHEQILPRDSVERIAKSGEVRNLFIDTCAETGQQSTIPAQYRTQEMIAESNMVGWLCHPAELGRAPDEIEFMESFESDDKLERFYLFRFRTLPPHVASEDGWMAGLSGPFTVSGMPTTAAAGSTFSRFDKWDEKTPKEHFDAIIGLLAEHWKRRSADLSNVEAE